jgi:hypothetical protein
MVVLDTRRRRGDRHRNRYGKAAAAVARLVHFTIAYLLNNSVIHKEPGANYFEHRHGPVVEAKRLSRGNRRHPHIQVSVARGRFSLEPLDASPCGSDYRQYVLGS